MEAGQKNDYRFHQGFPAVLHPRLRIRAGWVLIVFRTHSLESSERERFTKGIDVDLEPVSM